jgi:hypothetical protein
MADPLLARADTLLPEERMDPATADIYRGLLMGLIGLGYRIDGPPRKSGNVAGHWVVTTKSGFTIEFGPTNEEV